VSVGKESIKRAASAGTKTTKAKTTKAAASKTAKTTKTAKTAPKAETTAKTAATAKAEQAASAEPKTLVLTPQNAEELQEKFLSKGTADEKNGKPVQIKEELPVYLL
jgi:hypothetical protein